MTGIHQRTAPTKINRTDWNDLVTFLGGTSDDPQVDATKILLAQGGSLLSTWRYASDLTKMDAAKLLGDIAAARMQTNVLAAIIAAGGIVNADVATTAAIAKSKISTSSTWALTDIPAHNYVNPALSNPAGSNSTTYVHDGLAVYFTPTSTGKVFVQFKADLSNSGPYHAYMGIKYGTGVAPMNGAAETGTLLGLIGVVISAAGFIIGESSFAVVTGLSVGTQYWFDLVQKTTNALGTVNHYNVECIVIEI